MPPVSTPVPLPQCATYVSSSASGNTKTNTAATVESSYDAATHTVTWNVGDVNPAFMNIVLSVTVHYDDTCTDETVTNTAKLTGSEMHNETNVVTADASFTHRFDSEVRYGGGFNKRAMSQFERGKQGNWLYSYSNTSNVPVVMEYTDYMTCGLVSPTDGSKDCDKPLMRVKTIDTQTTTPIEITYWTNKGNTGTQTIYRGKAFDFSSFAADEYLTVFHYKQTIPAGESSILNVAGPIGAGEAAKASPDGYTLLFTTSSTHAISPHLMTRLAYKADKDFTPIAEIGGAASILLVTPSLPVRNVQELIAYAKAHPGALNYASSGNGTIVHLNAAAFAARAGLQLTHVPYKGTAQSITDLAAGQVHLLFDSIPTGMPHVASGRLRALAVTGDKRSALAPDLPTVAESSLPGYSSVTWFGVYGPAGMKPELVARINQAFNKAIQNPEVVASLAKQGVEAASPRTPAQFAAMVQADSARWAQVIKDNKITLD